VDSNLADIRPQQPRLALDADQPCLGGGTIEMVGGENDLDPLFARGTKQIAEGSRTAQLDIDHPRQGQKRFQQLAPRGERQTTISSLARVPRSEKEGEPYRSQQARKFPRLIRQPIETDLDNIDPLPRAETRGATQARQRVDRADNLGPGYERSPFSGFHGIFQVVIRSAPREPTRTCHLMISRKQEIALQTNQVADALVLVGSLYLGYALRRFQIIDFDFLPEIPSLESFVWIFLVVGLFGPLLLEMQGFYQYPLEKTATRSLRQIAYAGAWLGLILGACVVFLKLGIPSRSAFLIFMLLAPMGLLLREAVYRDIYLRRLRRGEQGEKVILAGTLPAMEKVLDPLSPVQRLEIDVVDRIDLEERGADALVDSIHRHSVGRVIFAFGAQSPAPLQDCIAACETEGVEAWIAANFVRASIARPAYDTLGPTPMLVLKVTPELSWALLLKGLMDRIGALLGILLLSPLLLLVALVIKCTSPGPVIFRQRRAGLHGKPFTMLKFRSMRTGAEQEHADLAGQNEMTGPVFKMADDPRITPFGRWLRKSSLDEFPQLFNVLAGQMSLVGPRPLPLYEVDNFELTAYRRRLSMKPGLTCLWQISGRSALKDFHDWVKLDVEYIDNWSLALDCKILLKTVPVVLLGIGAR
jgi:exopolysaccharide biosynthesis polyprenyl glycosylphosphotransferase